MIYELTIIVLWFCLERWVRLAGQAVDFLCGACVGKVPASARELGGESFWVKAF
jgi:hypothetical protein